MASQNAKFFCENCGAEVPQNAKVCRHCGRFFSSVRCPVCGLTGPSGKFSNGCPGCGYAISNGNKVKPPVNNDKMSSKKSRQTLIDEIDRKNGTRREDGTLPPWTFALMALVTAGIIFAAYKYLTNL